MKYIFLQASRADYHEAQQLLMEALRVRRKYMELSMQGFCNTTRQMLDGQLPPSSDFCVPDADNGEVRVTPAGDVIACELRLHHRMEIVFLFC